MGAPAAGKRVLITEDDESMREFLTMLVEREGFRVAHARDGGEALASAKAERPDLILLDLMLPSLGGYEVLRALQSDELRDVPVVVLTARFMDAKTVEMIRREPNVKEFMQKPPKPALLAGLLHRLLGTAPPPRGGP